MRNVPRRVLALALFSIVAGLGAEEGWRGERWTVEDFANVVGGGPSMGPADEAGGSCDALCGDAAGNLYLLNGNAVDIVTKDGLRRRLAGTGVPGFRDGPAHKAQFNQGGEYNVARSIQCDAKGNIYLPENGNNVVRRIRKDPGSGWLVETCAGGGKKLLKDGEACAALDVSLGGNIAAAAVADGTLVIGGNWNGIFRVDAEGKTVTKLGGWPASVGGHCLVMADADGQGNAYFVFRSNDAVVKVTKDGKIEHLAGLSPDVLAREKKAAHIKPHHIGDGKPRDIYIDTPTSIAASADGRCVYTCGGDEYNIRRIPADPEATTATLVRNGTWYVMPAHPNRNRPRRPCEFDPKLEGKSAIEGGPLSNLENCHICGKDAQGNLYGYLYSWCGETLRVAGRGSLRTKIYRLRKIAEGTSP